MPTIAVCSSANFYQQVVEIRTELEAMGHKAIIPISAERMEKSGNYDVNHHRTWLVDPKDYAKKTALMRQHFAEVEKSDAILVVNYEKHGQPDYIGGNVLMEMTLAFHLHKLIFILNEIPAESTFYEELVGMQPVVLHGKLADIKKQL